MKFVHIADMHFDIPFTLLSNKADLGEIRRVDQRQVFKKVIEYIKTENIPFLFISGDLYEHEYIRESTINYINNLFKEIPNTKIYITPGNHDPYLKNSYYNKFNWNENVYIFNSQIEKIELEECNIYGFGFDDFYCYDSKIEQIELDNKEKINILIAHGSLDGGYDEIKNYNTMSSRKIKDIGFDYIALGHIHKCNLSQENKNIIYPGSTISMGFDELGQHGMIVGEIKKDSIEIKFIQLDPKEFKEENLDITNINTEEELVEKIKEINIEENILYKIILIGKRNFEIDIYKIYKMIEIKNIIKIKDNTKLNYDLKEIANDYTLKGLFAQEILKEMENKDIDPEVLEKAIEIGIDVLS